MQEKINIENVSKNKIEQEIDELLKVGNLDEIFSKLELPEFKEKSKEIAFKIIEMGLWDKVQWNINKFKEEDKKEIESKIQKDIESKCEI